MRQPERFVSDALVVGCCMLHRGLSMVLRITVHRLLLGAITRSRNHHLVTYYGGHVQPLEALDRLRPNSAYRKALGVLLFGSLASRTRESGSLRHPHLSNSFSPCLLP